VGGRDRRRPLASSRSTRSSNPTRTATGAPSSRSSGPKTSFLAFTDNDGGADGSAIGDWTPSQGAPINPGVDHQTIGVGPFVPGLLGSTTGYPSAVYYASQDIASRSSESAATAA
jgi:hypothetical protein